MSDASASTPSVLVRSNAFTGCVLGYVPANQSYFDQKLKESSKKCKQNYIAEETKHKHKIIYLTKKEARDIYISEMIGPVQR